MSSEDHSLVTSNQAVSQSEQQHNKTTTCLNLAPQLRNPTLGNRVWAAFTFYPRLLVKLENIQCRRYNYNLSQPVSIIIIRRYGAEELLIQSASCHL